MECGEFSGRRWLREARQRPESLELPAIQVRQLAEPVSRQLSLASRYQAWYVSILCLNQWTQWLNRRAVDILSQILLSWRYILPVLLLLLYQNLIKVTNLSTPRFQFRQLYSCRWIIRRRLPLAFEICSNVEITRQRRNSQWRLLLFRNSILDHNPTSFRKTHCVPHSGELRE